MKCGHGNEPDKCIYPKCQETRGEERPADEGVTHGEDFRLAPKVVMHGKRCFVYCGDDHCNCDAGVRAGDQILYGGARGGGKSILRGFCPVFLVKEIGDYAIVAAENGVRALEMCNTREAIATHLLGVWHNGAPRVIQDFERNA